MSSHISKIRSRPDRVLTDIADYVTTHRIKSKQAYDTARLCLMDALGCGFEALAHPACNKLVGPVVPGAVLPRGARVPGTQFQLDPVTAAFNITCMIRWLDFNDHFSAAEGGHPSDNVGGILAAADWLSRCRMREGKSPLVVRDVLTAMIKAYEIQGVIGLENSFQRVGLDHVVLVKVASTAVITQLLGGTHEEVVNAVSNAWVDGQPLRVYRQSGNTGSRKSWAAADAVSRAVRFALMALRGEMGYLTALSAKTWGFYDVLFKGKPFKLTQPYDSYVMENVRFKISFPAEANGLTAAECAVKLHAQVRNRIDAIKKVVITTQGKAIRIIDKKGPLNNPADRDHCIQYIVAIVLLKGNLTAEHYEDHVAADPRIDHLRAKMVCVENKQWSRDVFDPRKRSVANAVQVFFEDGTKTEKVAIEYPIGDRHRRKESLPLLEEKFKNNCRRRFPEKQFEAIFALCRDPKRLESTPVNEFTDLFVI